MKITSTQELIKIPGKDDNTIAPLIVNGAAHIKKGIRIGFSDSNDPQPGNLSFNGHSLSLFSNNKYINLDIIEDGGWHFTNIMTAEKLYEKLTNFGHHDEFELSGLTVDDLKKKIKEKKVFFNHFMD